MINGNVVRSLLLDSYENKNRIIGSLLGRFRVNREEKEPIPPELAHFNSDFFRSLLAEGIARQLLTPTEVVQILKLLGDVTLYREFLSYVSGEELGDFYQSWFDDFQQTPSQQGKSKLDVIAEYIETGGVVEHSGNADRIGAREIPFGLEALGTAAFPADYPPEEARAVASRIVSYVTSDRNIHVPVESRRLMDLASFLVRYAERFWQYGPDYGDTLTSVNIPDGVASHRELYDRVMRMPPSEYRDRYLLGILKMKDLGVNMSEDDVSSLMDDIFRSLTEETYRSVDFRRDPEAAGLPRPWKAMKLRAAADDVAELFFFYNQDRDEVFPAIERITGRSTIFGDASKASTEEKLVHAAKAFPFIGNIRNYFIERALLPVIRRDADTASLTAEDRQRIFLRAHEIASGRTKAAIAGYLVEEELALLGDRLTFTDGVKLILQYMPEPSVKRDTFLAMVMNRTFTTWAEIDEGQILMQGHSYRTDVQSSAIRSAALEAVSTIIEDLSVGDRVGIVDTLLNIGKHILRKEDITPAFFDTTTKERLRGLLVGEHWKRYYSWGTPDESEGKFTITDAEFETAYPAIRDFLLSSFSASGTYTTGGSQAALPEGMREILRRFGLTDMKNLASPKRFNELINKVLGVEGFATSSLGPMFMQATEADRRQMLYRLSLGDDGFFEDAHFTAEGKKVLEGFIDLAVSTQEAISPEQGQKTWTRDEGESMKRVVVTTFTAMSPIRRAEVFSQVINMMLNTGGRVTREQFVQIGLTAFGVVGAKIGQMDTIFPEEFRAALSGLKEDVPPIPKATVAQILRAEGRDKYYTGLGPNLKNGSTAAVFLARHVDGKDRVIKVIRPDVKRNVASDIRAANSAVGAMTAEGVLSVDPTQVVEELTVLVEEELDPTNEARNIQNIRADLAKRGESPVGVPEVEYASKNHIEESRIEGKSLQEISVIRKKQQLIAGTLKYVDLSDADKKALHIDQEADVATLTITDEEKPFLVLDFKQIYIKTLREFFYQAFRLGLFHTDLHEGNIFVTADGDVNFIDYGQAGQEENVFHREALIKYLVGIAIQSPRLIGEALSVYQPDVTVGRFEQELVKHMRLFTAESSDPVVLQTAKKTHFLNGVTILAGRYHVEGSINRFTKALINIVPYMEQLDAKEDVAPLLRAYRGYRTIVFDILRTRVDKFTQRVLDIVPNPFKEQSGSWVDRLKNYIDSVMSHISPIRLWNYYQQKTQNVVDSADQAIGAAETQAEKKCDGGAFRLVPSVLAAGEPSSLSAGCKLFVARLRHSPAARRAPPPPPPPPPADLGDREVGKRALGIPGGVVGN